MTSQLGRWQGEFGVEYTDRNQVDWRTRVDTLRRIIPAETLSVLEVGCNRGHNLMALKEIMPDAMVIGTEPAEYARSQRQPGLFVYPFSIYELAELVMRFMQFDMAFTSGVLIHVPPERLDEALRAMHFASCRLILAIEYAGQDEAVEYRGHTDMLWKRDYGAHYQRLFPELKLIGTGENIPGFEGATYWLLQK
jgi:pseudaminic acid biosynthesis-associated methylase